MHDGLFHVTCQLESNSRRLLCELKLCLGGKWINPINTVNSLSSISSEFPSTEQVVSMLTPKGFSPQTASKLLLVEASYYIEN